MYGHNEDKRMPSTKFKETLTAMRGNLSIPSSSVLILFWTWAIPELLMLLRQICTQNAMYTTKARVTKRGKNIPSKDVFRMAKKKRLFTYYSSDAEPVDFMLDQSYEKCSRTRAVHSLDDSPSQFESYKLFRNSDVKRLLQAYSIIPSGSKKYIRAINGYLKSKLYDDIMRPLAALKTQKTQAILPIINQCARTCDILPPQEKEVLTLKKVYEYEHRNDKNGDSSDPKKLTEYKEKATFIDVKHLFPSTQFNLEHFKKRHEKKGNKFKDYVSFATPTANENRPHFYTLVLDGTQVFYSAHYSRQRDWRNMTHAYLIGKPVNDDVLQPEDLFDNAFKEGKNIVTLLNNAQVENELDDMKHRRTVSKTMKCAAKRKKQSAKKTKKKSTKKEPRTPLSQAASVPGSSSASPTTTTETQPVRPTTPPSKSAGQPKAQNAQKAQKEQNAQNAQKAQKAHTAHTQEVTSPRRAARKRKPTEFYVK